MRNHLIRSGLFTVAVLGLSMVLWACTSYARRQALSVFFDGVPEPGATEGKKVAGSPTRPTPGKKKVGSWHKPWWEQKCESCHEGMRREKGNTVAGFFPGVPRLVAPPEELCFRCHKPFKDKFIHGPAGLGACMTCHRPHQSHVAPHLLRRKEEAALCSPCHQGEYFVTRQRHLDEGWKRCLTCHDPHGAATKDLLRPPKKESEPEKAEDIPENPEKKETPEKAEEKAPQAPGKPRASGPTPTVGERR